MPFFLSEDDAQILTVIVFAFLALTLWGLMAYDDKE